ncbi:MAG: polysaccharide biosynthesis C-terminal domain-containing protein, partial [bacterium]
WLFLLYVRNSQAFQFAIRFDEWKHLVRQSIPLGMASFLAQTIINVPVLIVGAIVSSQAAGLFNAAMKLIFFALVIDRVFYAMFFPVISRHRASDMEQFKRSGSLGLKIVLAVSIPVVIAGSVFAGQAVQFVYGADFAGAAIPFQILLLYFLFSVTNTVFMSMMIADNREAEYLRTMALGTAVLIVLCLICSWFYGVAGASAAVAIGEGTITAMLVMKERARTFQKLWKVFAPSLVSGMLMLGVLLLLNSWTMFVAVPIGLIIFASALWLLKGISIDEIFFLRERFL